jgi:hypothetical protein
MARKFLPAYSKEFKHISAGKDEYHALCTCCDCQIDLASTGKPALTRHLDTLKHKTNVTVISENQLLSLFIKPKLISDTEHIGSAKSVWSY